MDLEKTLLRKVGEAIHRFRMIRDGDRVAVALSGGKDSATLLEALLLLAKRAPIEFSVCAFTVEQGKFLRPIEPLGEYLRQRGVAWTYYRDAPSLKLLEDQPEHGCDLCSRYRRRAVYQIARELGANVIALGHTADDFCESLLRNTMFTGRLSALPPVTWSRERDFQMCIRDRYLHGFPAEHDRGVRRAPFVVLIGATMPSVLAEIGFLSNPKEEALLRRPEYRQKVAEALVRGVEHYAAGLSHFQVAQNK